MSKICVITGKKARIQRSKRHASGKSRSGTRAFAAKGPHGLKGVKKRKVQNLNFVRVKTVDGTILVSMKAYKKYFKTPWKSEVKG